MSLPYNITNQCTGRTNSVRLAPQRMRFAMGSFASAVSTIPANKSVVATPPACVRKTSLSILPSFSLASSLISIPFFLAKASAALLGLPSSSNAIFVGGPQTTTSLSGVLDSNSLTITANRRGVA